jgi:hypothetical protein
MKIILARASSAYGFRHVIFIVDIHIWTNSPQVLTKITSHILEYSNISIIYNTTDVYNTKSVSCGTEGPHTIVVLILDLVETEDEGT